MAYNSNFVQSSCFTYLTSPILASSRGGEAYEVPLYRVLANARDKATKFEPFNKKILGVSNLQKSAFVPDVATSWYAYHLKQLKEAEQREREKEEAHRELSIKTLTEAENMRIRQQQLLADYYKLSLYDDAAIANTIERSKGGQNTKKCVKCCKSFNTPSTTNHIKYISPEFRALLRTYNEQMRNNDNTTHRLIAEKTKLNNVGFQKHISGTNGTQSNKDIATQEKESLLNYYFHTEGKRDISAESNKRNNVHAVRRVIQGKAIQPCLARIRNSAKQSHIRHKDGLSNASTEILTIKTYKKPVNTANTKDDIHDRSLFSIPKPPQKVPTISCPYTFAKLKQKID